MAVGNSTPIYNTKFLVNWGSADVTLTPVLSRRPLAAGADGFGTVADAFVVLRERKDVERLFDLRSDVLDAIDCVRDQQGRRHTAVHARDVPQREWKGIAPHGDHAARVPGVGSWDWRANYLLAGAQGAV